MFEAVPADWREALVDVLADHRLVELEAFVAAERAAHAVYPPERQVFEALRLTPYAAVRAVIVGQDPYHGPNQAHGLAFSVPSGVPAPPSLRNILAEWAADLAQPLPPTGSLVPWAEHGALLLNRLLTVRGGAPRSHAHQGWELFSAAVIAAVAARRDPVVFLLWGADAQEVRRFIDPGRHVVLSASHPSPLSARRPSGAAPPFRGSRPFSQANDALRRRSHPALNWSLAG